MAAERSGWISEILSFDKAALDAELVLGLGRGFSCPVSDSAQTQPGKRGILCADGSAIFVEKTISFADLVFEHGLSHQRLPLCHSVCFRSLCQHTDVVSLFTGWIRFFFGLHKGVLFESREYTD